MSDKANIDPLDIQTTRSRWQHKLLFACTAIGYCIGFGNIWRYPYLSYKHGALWLPAYIYVMIIMGFPMLILELTLG